MHKMKVYLFEERQNPSSDYYIIPAFEICGFSISRVSIWADRYPEIEEGDWIVVVRYFNKKLIRFLKSKRNIIERLIYFMDDGLWDLNIIKNLPVEYAFKIFKKAYLYRGIIKDLNAELWVSTDYLLKKYNGWRPKVIYPYPLNISEQEKNIEKDTDGLPVIFYHGTSSHKKEISWLKDLVDKFSGTSTQCLFEQFLDKRNWKYFKNFHNLISLRPVEWECYLNYSSLKYRTIGLAPLFDNEFNRGRSWIKFFDITRSGAVGIYSEHAPYAELIKDFQAGLVEPMEIESWINAIGDLIKDSEYREILYKNALKLIQYLRKKAEESYSKAIYGREDTT